MWSPTHVQVLVKRAKGLKAKGKDGTNDAFVTIGLGKEKFRTSTKEKAGDPIEWMEQCELAIPTQGNTAEIGLTVLHRNLLGVDEFLGQVTLPLKDFDVYERPKTKWYPLKCKPGQSKNDYRGELEVRLGFTVKASESVGGSTADLTKKNKGSLSSLNKVAGNIGGSLMSLGNKEKKNIKKLAKSVTHKVEKVGEKAKKSVSSLKLHRGGALDSVPETGQWNTLDRRSVDRENRDPGVNSDDEGDDMFKFETLSHKSSASELSMNRLGRVSTTSTPFSGSLEAFNVETPPTFRQNTRLQQPQFREKERDDWESKLLGKKGDLQADSISTSSRQSAVSSIIGGRSGGGGLDSQSVTSSSRGGAEDSQSVASSTGGGGGASSLTSGASQVTLEDNWRPQNSLPSYSQAVAKPQQQQHQKKKIIPVRDDFESSPSPETPSSPVEDRTWTPPQQQTPQSTRFGVSASSMDLSNRDENKRRTLGLKLKNSYSFKEKEDGGKGLKGTSVDSEASRHSRTHSDGSSYGPPNGTRVVLGRETSPIPSTGKLPQDVLAKYGGKSKEELIEQLVKLERTVESQAKRVGDLEDYIDGLLIRVMEVAPVLLQKDLNTQKATISSGLNGSEGNLRNY